MAPGIGRKPSSSSRTILKTLTPLLLEHVCNEALVDSSVAPTD